MDAQQDGSEKNNVFDIDAALANMPTFGTSVHEDAENSMTKEVTLDLGILGTVTAEVTFTYSGDYSGEWCEKEYDAFNYERVTVNGEDITSAILEFDPIGSQLCSQLKR